MWESRQGLDYVERRAEDRTNEYFKMRVFGAQASTCFVVVFVLDPSSQIGSDVTWRQMSYI